MNSYPFRIPSIGGQRLSSSIFSQCIGKVFISTPEDTDCLAERANERERERLFSRFTGKVFIRFTHMAAFLIKAIAFSPFSAGSGSTKAAALQRVARSWAEPESIHGGYRELHQNPTSRLKSRLNPVLLLNSEETQRRFFLPPPASVLQGAVITAAGEVVATCMVKGQPFDPDRTMFFGLWGAFVACEAHVWLGLLSHIEFSPIPLLNSVLKSLFNQCSIMPVLPRSFSSLRQPFSKACHSRSSRMRRSEPFSRMASQRATRIPHHSGSFRTR